MKMLSGMVEPNGDPTTLKKEERAMRPTPEVVRKWSSKQKYAKQHLFILPNLVNLYQIRQNWAHNSNRNRLGRWIKTSKTSLTGTAKMSGNQL